MGLFLPACIAGSSDVDARRALRARAFFWLGFAGHGHAPSTTGRRLSSLRQTATNRGRYIGEPSDRLPARLVRWTPRRRIAYLGWADRVRRSIVSLDTASITAQGGVAHVEERSSRRARGRPGCRPGTARSCRVGNKVGPDGSFQTADAAAAEMKDCAGKWQDEKARTGVKGRAAYRKFMGDCLKKAPA